MAITTEGSSGIVSGSETLADDTNGAINRGSVTLFTTPNTTDSTFIVNVSGFAKFEDTSTDITRGVIAIAGDSSGNSSGSISQSISSAQIEATIKVGPNTAVDVVYLTENGSSSSGNFPSFEYDFTYNYLGAVVS